MPGATNATSSALPAIQGEIDAICKDLCLSVDHLNHGDLAGMYAGLREVASEKERRLLALTPDTWAFGIASSEPVRTESTIVDAEGRRLAPEISLAFAPTLNQMSTGTWSPATPMMMSGAPSMHMPMTHNFAAAEKSRTQANVTSSSAHVKPTPTRIGPDTAGQQTLRFMDNGMASVSMMQHASQLQLSFNCPDLAADCEEFTSVPVNMAVAKPVCHVKLRPVPLCVADVVEKMARLEELIGQEEYEWRLMSLKQEFAGKGIVPHPSRR